MIVRTVLMIGAALLLSTPVIQADDASPRPEVTRAVATLNGVFSPRGFFNITVRLYQLSGVEWAKFDLKKSQITLDFAPGVAVHPDEIQKVMVDAGYKPGPVRIQTLLPEDASKTGPGWVKIKHPSAKNPLLRWLQLNF